MDALFSAGQKYLSGSSGGNSSGGGGFDFSSIMQQAQGQDSGSGSSDLFSQGELSQTVILNTGSRD